MKAQDKRIISIGSEYDKYFPPARNAQTTRVRGNESVHDTLNVMREITRESLPHTKKIAPVLKRSNTYDTCANIWDFVYKNIQYAPDDPNVEQIRTPARTWQDRFKGVDCDCMSVFIGSILTNLGIPFEYRVTGYKKKKNILGFGYNYCDDYQHVYPVAFDYDGTEIIIDCVLDEFDKEKPYCKVLNMAVVELSGFGSIGKDDSATTETPLSTDALKDKLGTYLKGSLPKGATEKVERLNELKNSSKIAQAVGDNMSTAILTMQDFDLKTAFEDRDYATILRETIKASQPIAKAAINAVVPGGGAILDVANGFASLFGFSSMVELWAAPFIAIADIASQIPEAMQYLVPTVQSHYTDCEVLAFHKDAANIDITAFTTGRIICCCGDGAGNPPDEWKLKVLNMLRVLFEKAKENVKLMNYYGIPQEERNDFYNWCAWRAKRYHIYQPSDFTDIGFDPQRTDWDDDNIQDLNTITGLYTWVYSWKGYQVSADPSKRDNPQLDQWFGKCWKGVKPMTCLEMANDWGLRLQNNQVDLLTGAELFISQPDGSYIKPPKDWIITPNYIYETNEVFVKKNNGLDGFNGVGDFVPLKQHYSTELGITSQADFAAAQAAAYDAATSEEDKDKKQNSWIPYALLILIPILGAAIAYFLRKRKDKSK